MSLNSTANCSAAVGRLVETARPYCLLPRDTPRVETCCLEYGTASQPTLILPECYVWCNIVPTNATPADVPDVESVFRSFAGCVTGTGANNITNASLPGSQCGLGTTDIDGNPVERGAIPEFADRNSGAAGGNGSSGGAGEDAEEDDDVQDFDSGASMGTTMGSVFVWTLLASSVFYFGL